MRLFKNYRLLLVLAAACAVMAALAATAAINSYLNLVAVVVASRDIKPNELIGEGDLALKEFPARMAGTHWLRSMEGVAGKASTGFIPAGMPITNSMLSEPADAGLAGRLKLYPGTVALSLEAKNDTTVGQAVKPGDHVDVYALSKGGGAPGAAPGAQLVAIGVPVLATPTGNDALAAKAVVLAVTPEQATRILNARAAGDDLACTLNKAGD
ncbi:Flp pilus assembly protein RcpC/CpaB (plasmid) [Neomoorella glycerini]|uniref:Flp pilus assembly protein RcpC/CpaB n=1 Tax=Neomoorella glycerini TaxID=55779 RepID=A0A6I5ZXE3_9FIRM|nr:Flp pilus assembly protein CpaB [Moorella glycerini]QGP94127.1 Flp pilus assembly protein RcpC/CpaB [Moorella glycerini]